MLHLILGPPRSGKSVYAERLMAGYPGRTVYVGTLPRTRQFEDVIRLHTERRPAGWGLIELARDPRPDLQALAAAFSEYRNVFVDGLSYYLLRVVTLCGGDLSELRSPTRSLIETAAGRVGETIVVDAPPPEASGGPERDALRDLHLMLARRAGRVTRFEAGRVASDRCSEPRGRALSLPAVYL